MATKAKGAKSAKGGAKKGAKKAVLKPGEPIVLEVTKEVYFLNTVFFEAEGVGLGDKIEVSEATLETLKLPKDHPLAKEEDKNKVLKVGAVAPAKKVGKITHPVAIMKGEEFIRIYPKGLEDKAEELLAKDPNLTGVSPKAIKSITVSWRESEKVKEEVTGRMVDTGRMITQSHKFTPSNGDNWQMDARELANSGPRRSCIAVMV